ncbi:uncharacterized protein LOC135498459 [Lineus longissimus]|uniref:uncharacterized protein LOC135498459 n=1 Tax=Lineus longissimus TaxID=88925 RepID=UPI00315D01D5
MQFYSLLPLALYLGISSLSYARAESESCNKLSHYGKTRQDLSFETSTHGRNMIVFLSPTYAVKQDGFLLGWTFYSQQSGGSFFLDVLEEETPTNQFHVVLKTSVTVAKTGNHTIIMKDGLRVKKGQVLGVHSKTGAEVGIAFSSYDEAAKGEIILAKDVSDEVLKEMGNRVDRRLHRKGRWEALMAHVLTLRAVRTCNAVFEISSRTTFSAVLYETHSGQTGVSCAIRCVQHHLCLSFVYASDGWCKLYSMISDDAHTIISDDQESLKAVNASPGEIVAIASFP